MTRPPAPNEIFIAGIRAEDGVALGTLDLHALLEHADVEPSHPEVRGLVAGRDSQDLTQAGWGLVVGRDEPDATLAALEPLVALRREQVGREHAVFRERLVYQPGQTAEQFLLSNGSWAGGGPVEPERVPYYLVLVGGPDVIPFDVQYSLGVQHAVGRLHFATAAEYRAYAEKVVRRERQPAAPPKVSLFAPHHSDDPATRLLLEHLFDPLHARLLDACRQTFPSWDARDYRRGMEATKSALHELVQGPSVPALLVTGGHGAAFADPFQEQRQGSIVCSNWRGGPMSAEHLFGGQDIRRLERPSYEIGLHFGCFSAGACAKSPFEMFSRPSVPIQRDFVAALPKRLLAEPNGPLAFIGHIDRAWTYSFWWSGAGSSIGSFYSTCYDLMLGRTVGSVVGAYFGSRYAQLSADRLGEFLEVHCDLDRFKSERAAAMIATLDSRSYVLLGDPAVRIRVAAPGREKGVPHADTARAVGRS